MFRYRHCIRHFPLPSIRSQFFIGYFKVFLGCLYIDTHYAFPVAQYQTIVLLVKISKEHLEIPKKVQGSDTG